MSQEEKTQWAYHFIRYWVLFTVAFIWGYWANPNGVEVALGIFTYLIAVTTTGYLLLLLRVVYLAGKRKRE